MYVMRDMKTVYKLLLPVLFLLMIGNEFRLNAQTDGVLLSLEMMGYPKEVMWSSDSQRLAFYDISVGTMGIPSVNTPDEGWVEFNVTTQTLSRSTRWPLQPQLSAQEQQLLAPGVSERGEESLVFESPSGNYIACLCGGLALYDRSQQTLQYSGYTVMQPFAGPDEFSVLWSEDESAFVFKNVDDSDYIYAYYVHNYQPQMENLEVIEADPQIQGQLYSFFHEFEFPAIQKAYDISDDGEWVLMLARPVISTNDLEQIALRVIVWNTQNSDESYLIGNVKPDTIKGMSFAGTSHTELLIVNEDGLIHYNVLTGTQTVIDASIQPSHAYFSPDSRYLAMICCWDVSGNQTINMTILDLHQLVTLPTAVPTNTSTFTPESTDETYTALTIAWSPNGSQIAVSGGSPICNLQPTDPLRTVQILDASTRQVIQTLTADQCNITSLDWSSDSSKVAASSGDSFGVRVWDVQSGQLLSVVEKGGQGVSIVKWRPNQLQLAVAASSNGTAMMDANTGEILVPLPVGGTNLDWNPDGTKLVSVSGYENFVYIADMMTNTHLTTFSGHTNVVGIVDWSPDGTKIASGSIDIKIWNSANGQELRTLTPSTQPYSMEWRPRSNHLVVGEFDGSVRIWDTDTGLVLETFQAIGPVYDVSWSPDGSRLAYTDGGNLETSIPTNLVATNTPVSPTITRTNILTKTHTPIPPTN